MAYKQNSAHKQDGVILIVALVFLIAISLLSIAAVKSSNFGLRMAQNDESRIAAEQGAQAVADAIISDSRTTPVINDPGYTVCTVNEAGCSANDLVLDNATLASAVTSGYISARVERMSPALRPPPRVTESSIDKFLAASFEATSTYDRVDEGLGTQRVTEGVLVLVPAM